MDRRGGGYFARPRRRSRLFVVASLISFFPPVVLAASSAATERIKELDAELSEAERLVKGAEQRSHSLRSRREEISGELESLRARAETCGAEGRRLLKELEVKREEEVELLGNR